MKTPQLITASGSRSVVVMDRPRSAQAPPDPLSLEGYASCLVYIGGVADVPLGGRLLDALEEVGAATPVAYYGRRPVDELGARAHRIGGPRRAVEIPRIGADDADDLARLGTQP